GKETHDLNRGSAERSTQPFRIEDPDIGAWHAAGGHLWIACSWHVCDGGIDALLPAMRGGDECACGRAGEYDVPRFIAHQQGADHVRCADQTDDADAIG